MLNKNRVALFFGTLAALVHLVLVVLVAAGWAQGYIDWITGMHFLNTGITVQSFDALKALELVVLAFIVGNVMGFIISTLWNEIVGKHK